VSTKSITNNIVIDNEEDGICLMEAIKVSQGRGINFPESKIRRKTMRVNDLMNMQRELDDFIIASKGLQHKGSKDMINALFCAMFSELKEVEDAIFVGDAKCMILEEKIDVLHFLLAIGYRVDLDKVIGVKIDNIVFETTEITSGELMFKHMVELMDSVKSYKFWSNKISDSTYIVIGKWMTCFRFLWVYLLIP
jgi:dimeric dUTPase (all-alpha-NTP-PPase superfamily)